MVINLLKSLLSNGEGSEKNDPESVSGTGSPPKVNQFFRLLMMMIIIIIIINDRIYPAVSKASGTGNKVGPMIAPSFNEIG